MGTDFITIGGIRYDANQVKGYERQGNSFTVTLTDGSKFKYNNQDIFHTNAGRVDYNGKIPTIFGQNMNKGDKGPKDITITNCRLTMIEGTNEDDILVLNDSKVNTVDLSGDPNNHDMIVVNGKSDIYRKLYADENDKVIDNSDKGFNVRG
ncbi:hypothetical protein IJ541_05470 [bacterium]|nr:hypothetical protein [bacterium]